MIEPEFLPYFLNEAVYLIPDIQHEVIPFAFFHNAREKQELELLMKIVSACDLEEFKIFDHLDFKDIMFEKAIVFTKREPLYEIIEIDNCQLVFSNTLHILKNDAHEKARLWNQIKLLTK